MEIRRDKTIIPNSTEQACALAVSHRYFIQVNLTDSGLTWISLRRPYYLIRTGDFQ